MKRNARESKELTSWQNNLSGTRVRTHKTTYDASHSTIKKKENPINKIYDMSTENELLKEEELVASGKSFRVLNDQEEI